MLMESTISITAANSKADKAVASAQAATARAMAEFAEECIISDAAVHRRMQHTEANTTSNDVYL